MAEWADTLEQLIRDRERALLGYAYLVCGDPVHAQDLVQDALVKTFSKPRPGLTISKAESYVRRAITTLYVDEYRRSQRWQRVQHLFKPDTRVEAPFDYSVSDDISDALAKLSPRTRSCVVLRFFDDLSVPEIARQLGLATGSVKRYLSDGVKALEISLGPMSDTYLAHADVADVTTRSGRGGYA